MPMGHPVSSKAAAIVLGLDNVTGLQSARLLSRRGIPVIGIARDVEHYCCRTNACERLVFADTSSEELIQRLEFLGPTLSQKAVLYPCTDMSVLLVSRMRDRLRPYFQVMLPPPDVVETLTSKLSFVRFAKENNLRIPGTALLSGEEDVERAIHELTFPCILKPPVKTPLWEKRTTAKAFILRSESDLRQTYARCSEWSDSLILQELIQGPVTNQYTCNVYFGESISPLVTFVTQKLRQWPPDTGTGCLGIECRDDEVVRETLRLFSKVEYRGLGYVEMKRDERDGRCYLIEPNIGRPTGRSATAEASGVELLYTMYCDALKLPLPQARSQTYRGVRWISLRRDLLSAFSKWRAGDITAGEWWSSWRRPRTFAVLSWNDPMPFFADLVRSVKLLLRRKIFSADRSDAHPVTNTESDLTSARTIPNALAQEPSRPEPQHTPR